MYAQVEKSKENKSKAVANSVAQQKNNVAQGLGFVDNRPVAVAQRRLKNTINSGTKIAQMRSDKRIEDSARKHYNDGWGAKYGIQNDDSLKAKVPDSVKGDGTVDLKIWEYQRWVYKGDTYRKGKRCTIEYKDGEEGWGKYKSKYTSIYHCGPMGSPITQKL